MAKDKTEAQQESERKEGLLRKQAQYAADKALREAHEDEYQDLYAKACAERSVTYVRPVKPVDKARAQVEALFAQYPDLAAEFSDQP